MKTTVSMDENDIRQMLADRFGADPKAIRFRYRAEMQDGPHYSPPGVTVEIDVNSDDQPATIGQQTVVMGGAVFGPTNIVIPKRG